MFALVTYVINFYRRYPLISPPRCVKHHSHFFEILTYDRLIRVFSFSHPLCSLSFSRGCQISKPSRPYASVVHPFYMFDPSMYSFSVSNNELLGTRLNYVSGRLFQRLREMRLLAIDFETFCQPPRRSPPLGPPTFFRHAEKSAHEENSAQGSLVHARNR